MPLTSAFRGNRRRGGEQVPQQQLVRLDQALGFPRQHPTREVRDETAGKQQRGLLRDVRRIRKLGGSGAQSVRETLEASLVLESNQWGKSDGLDQQDARQRWVGGEEPEAGPQAGGETGCPIPLDPGRRRDRDGKSLDSVSVSNREISIRV